MRSLSSEIYTLLNKTGSVQCFLWAELEPDTEARQFYCILGLLDGWTASVSSWLPDPLIPQAVGEVVVVEGGDTSLWPLKVTQPQEVPLQEQTCFRLKSKKDWPVTLVSMMPLRETPGHSANEEMKKRLAAVTLSSHMPKKVADCCRLLFQNSLTCQSFTYKHSWRSWTRF